MAEKKKIFVGGIYLESNSFTPVKTYYEDFTLVRGADCLQASAGCRLLQDKGYELVFSQIARAVPGGVMDLADFVRLTDEILDKIPRDRSVDGVFLDLHGAFDVEGVGSGEAYLVSRIREMVGPQALIAAALDLHANNTYTLAGLCNILYGYRTAPHIDEAETSYRAAALLDRALQENQTPWTQLYKLPLMLPGEKVMTDYGMGKEIMAKLPQLEEVEGVWCASYFVGMAWCDCVQNGATLALSGVGHKSPARRAMQAFMDWVWARREDFTFPLKSMPPQASVDFAAQSQDRPFFISDSGDNVTAGAVGDNALLLDLLVKKGLDKVLIAAIVDPKGVDLCWQHQPGDQFALAIGGKQDTASVQVAFDSVQLLHNYPAQPPYCKASLVRAQGADVLLFALREPVFTQEDLAHFQLSAFDYDIIVVKQGYLTPQFTQIAGDLLMALTPGHCAQDLLLMDFQNIPRPMYPFDTEFTL